MGGEKIHSLYLQQKDTSSHGPYIYRTVLYHKTDFFQAGHRNSWREQKTEKKFRRGR